MEQEAPVSPDKADKCLHSLLTSLQKKKLGICVTFKALRSPQKEVRIYSRFKQIHSGSKQRIYVLSLFLALLFSNNAIERFVGKKSWEMKRHFKYYCVTADCETVKQMNHHSFDHEMKQ